MSFQDFVVLSLVFVGCITSLGFLFGPTHNRAWAAWFSFAYSIYFILILGFIIVVSHFVVKYW